MNRCVKICFIRHNIFPGDPRVKKEVESLVAAGHRVDVICLKKDRQPSIENVKGARVFRIPLKHKRRNIFRYLYEYSFSFLYMAVFLSYRHFLEKYDVVQVNTMPDIHAFTTILPRLLGARVVVDFHEPTPELWVTKYGEKQFRFLYHLQVWVEKLAIRYSHLAITVTEVLKARFVERGADPGKIEVIPNVCDETIFTGLNSPENHDPEKFIIVTHGSIEKRYGHEVLVRAMAILRDKFPQVHLNILGKGSFVKKMKQLITELKCEDNVHYLGFVPFMELLARLSEADAGIISMYRSPYSELIDTNKMYEYISIKKPILVSRLPAIETNFDETSVMFFKPGDHTDLARKIIILFENPEKRNILSENAYNKYKKISWDISKLKYVGLIEKIANK